MDGNMSLEEGNTKTLNQTTSHKVQMVINLEEFTTIAEYADLIILPTIAIVGLLGNALSGLMVIKNGLDKPSNILLLGLAVSDFFLMLNSINVPYLMMYASPAPIYWMMDLNSIIICYNVTLAINVISVLAVGMSVTLTVFITLERIVAVFFPLQFSRLVTPLGAKFAVILSFVLQIPTAVISRYRVRLFVFYYEVANKWIGYATLQKFYIGSRMELYYNIISWYILPIIPTIVVTVGCILIGGKISVAVRRRKTISPTVRNRKASARTRTLFMVCFSFSVTHISYLFLYLPQLSSYDLSGEWFYVARLYALFVNFLQLCNGAVNFFIYVIFNPKFRKLITQSMFNLGPIKGSAFYKKIMGYRNFFD